MSRIYVGLNKASGIFLVDVVVSTSALVQKRNTLATPFRTKALIDTGAALCGISQKGQQALKLPVSSNKLYRINTGNGMISSRRYYGAFYLEDEPGLRCDCCVMNVFKFETRQFDFIIGMNVLDAWSLSYDPKDRGLWLEYPPS